MTSRREGRQGVMIRTRRTEGPPLVAVRVWLPGGSRRETTPGEALVAGRLLAEGTRRRDWRRIAVEAEDHGATISTTAGYEAQSLAVDALAPDWERALDWAAELTLESSFPADRCRWLIEKTASDLDALFDHPDTVAEWAFRRQLYGSHARGRPLEGTEEGLAAVTAEACAERHREALARGLIVTVAGTIDPRAVRSRAEELFGGVADSGAVKDPPAVPIRGLEKRQRVRLTDGEQAHLFIGALSVQRDDPMRPALDLLALVLGAGGGLFGRIPQRVREKEGLAYECQVATTLGSGLDPGRSEIYVATSPRQVERVEKIVHEELERIASSPVSEDELEEARSFVLGSDPFRRETARQWADLLATAAFYGQPEDRVEWTRSRYEAVSVDDLAHAARRFLDPAKLSTTVAVGG